MQFKYILNWELNIFERTQTHTRQQWKAGWRYLRSHAVSAHCTCRPAPWAWWSCGRSSSASAKQLKDETENKQRVKAEYDLHHKTQGQRGKTADGVVDKAFGKEMRGAGNVNKPKNIYVLFWGIVQFGTDPMSQIKKLVKLVKNLFMASSIHSQQWLILVSCFTAYKLLKK